MLPASTSYCGKTGEKFRTIFRVLAKLLPILAGALRTGWLRGFGSLASLLLGRRPLRVSSLVAPRQQAKSQLHGPSAAEHCDEVAQFLVHLGGGRDGVGHLFPDQMLVPFAQ